MRPDDVRALFACIDVEPSTTFSGSLLTRLQSEREVVDRLPSGVVGGPIEAPVLLDLRPVSPASNRNDERPRRPRHRGRIVAAFAAVIVATVVVTTTDDPVELTPPAGQPTTTESTTTTPPEPAMDLPEGLHALPPEGAEPSVPATGELLAELPMPVWVYEDGRVISARWSGNVVPDDWSGFLEQRLTAEGVELVRSEIQTSDPMQNLCRAGGAGGYGFSDGGRGVCAHATSGPWEDVYPRLYELPDGAPTWLPASAWADSTPKPFVPSSYAILIEDERELTRAAVVNDLPPAVARVLAPAPACAFEVFPPSHGEQLCWKVTTDEARAVVDHEGFGAQYGRGVLMGTGWGYFFDIIPYLPHDKAVWCCGG